VAGAAPGRSGGVTEQGHLSLLRAASSGAVLAPGDAAYDAHRVGWNRRVVHRPRAIVLAHDAHDVVAALEFAERHQLDHVVQATGHGPVRPAGADAILVDVSGIRGARFDGRTGTATVGGGARWTSIAVAAARARAGLVAVAPAHHHVGVAGSALVGGFGWLARAHGLSRDHVVGAEVVLPGGETVDAGLERHPEVLWALRAGATHTRGVITALTVRLVPQPDVYAGELRFPAEMAPEVLARYDERLAEVPPELTSSVVLEAGPPGRVALRACHAGRISEGRAWVDGWRRWAAVADDRFTVRPAASIASLDDEPVAPTALATRTAWLRSLCDDAISLLAPAAFARDPAAGRVEVRHVDGAVTAGGGPELHESSALLLRVTATAGTGAADPVERRLAALHADLVATGATTSGAYAGFAAPCGLAIGAPVGARG